MDIKELITRGVEEIIEKEHLLKRLKSREKLRVKFGIDPTGPKIHLGRAVAFWKLRAFQQLGHQIVLIIGDFTAQIGDASDKKAMRRPLTEKEVKENMKGYKRQIGKILDLKKTEIHYNSKWLKNLNLKKLLPLCMLFTAQQMIQRKNFKERWEKKKPIGVHEMVYPILQGYDSVMVKADLEIGGSDQLFNMKVGREIQRYFGQKPQDLMTLKILPGLDGRKMSTSWQNVVNIEEKAEEMFGKIMSMRDELIVDYFTLATTIPLNEVRKIKKELKEGKINPMDAKLKLAREIVSLYYGEKKAISAQDYFQRVFQKRKYPKKMPTLTLKKGKIPLSNLLVLGKLVSSKSEAKRVIKEGGVRINGRLIKNWAEKILIKNKLIVQVGKRKFLKIKCEKNSNN